MCSINRFTRYPIKSQHKRTPLNYPLFEQVQPGINFLADRLPIGVPQCIRILTLSGEDVTSASSSRLEIECSRN